MQAHHPPRRPQFFRHELPHFVLNFKTKDQKPTPRLHPAHPTQGQLFWELRYIHHDLFRNGGTREKVHWKVAWFECLLDTEPRLPERDLRDGSAFE